MCLLSELIATRLSSEIEPFIAPYNLWDLIMQCTATVMALTHYCCYHSVLYYDFQTAQC